MRRSVTALCCLVFIAVAQPAGAANVTNLHHVLTTVAEIDASTCAWIAPFIYEIECSDTFVQYGQGRITKYAPRYIFVFNVHYILHPGSSPDEPEFEFLFERYGSLSDVGGYLDTTRLLHADVTADVPMNDGSTLPLDLHWDFTGAELNVAGFDGPVQEEGAHWGTHTSDRCFTANWLAHQTWRWGGAISGTVDGVDASTLSKPPQEGAFIGRGIFTIVETEHGGCA